MTVNLFAGDCREVLRDMPDCSIDSIVTDPPYEISFMNKKWDGSGIAYNVDMWSECLRVLKPGGYLLAFGATRTYHRMTVAIEDAGFEIRDSIHWIYGSGFPKSLNVSKAIDKKAGAEREVVATQRLTGNAAQSIQEKGGTYASNTDSVGVAPIEVPITAPATEEAKKWDGFGTALKPAHEPIVVARKPLDGTVTANVLEHGVGALNIDGCRIPMGEEYDPNKIQRQSSKGEGAIEGAFGAGSLVGKEIQTYKPGGRWPANLVFTHSADCGDECAEECPILELDEQSGNLSGGNFPTQRGAGVATGFGKGRPTEGGARKMNDFGGASRYFTTTNMDEADYVPFKYVAKTSKKERNAGLDGLPAKFAPTMNDGIGGKPHNPDTATPKQNHHPTVKPIDLMRWLVRLVTPPSGTVLDPFAGSGTTLVAAILEGINAIGIELAEEYHPIIQGRVQWAQNNIDKEKQ